MTYPQPSLEGSARLPPGAAIFGKQKRRETRRKMYGYSINALPEQFLQMDA